MGMLYPTNNPGRETNPGGYRCGEAMQTQLQLVLKRCALSAPGLVTGEKEPVTGLSRDPLLPSQDLRVFA